MLCPREHMRPARQYLLERFEHIVHCRLVL
jgi:hypothetical protein